MSKEAPEGAIESPLTGLCANCVGACCRRFTRIPLKKDEAVTQSAAGTLLEELLPAGDGVNWGSRRYARKHMPDDTPKFVRREARGLRPGEGLFGFLSECAFLEELDNGQFGCSVRDDPSIRPEACGRLEEGSSACKEIRARVIVSMLEEDSLIPSLAGVALGEEVFQAIEGL